MTNSQPTGQIKKSRKTYSPEFKFKVAKEADKTGNYSEVSRKFGVSVNVVSAWVSQLNQNGSSIFKTSPDKETNKLKTKVARLEQMLGKKEVELGLLKNFSDFYESQNGT